MFCLDAWNPGSAPQPRWRWWTISWTAGSPPSSWPTRDSVSRYSPTFYIIPSGFMLSSNSVLVFTCLWFYCFYYVNTQECIWAIWLLLRKEPQISLPMDCWILPKCEWLPMLFVKFAISNRRRTKLSIHPRDPTTCVTRHSSWTMINSTSWVSWLNQNKEDSLHNPPRIGRFKRFVIRDFN